MDHDIVDGAPAARFTQQLQELIESGYGLSDQDFIFGGLPPNIRCSQLASLGYAGTDVNHQVALLSSFGRLAPAMRWLRFCSSTRWLRD